MGFDAAGRVVAIDIGQMQIHQDEVWAVCDRGAHPLGAGRGFQDPIADAGQEVPQNLPIVLVILDHQNLDGHVSSSGAATRIGIVHQNVAPWPGHDRTPMSPPWSSTICLAIARPSPVPCCGRVRAWVPCSKAVKMRACSAAAIPGPVSRTRRVNLSSEAETTMPTSPTSV